MTRVNVTDEELTFLNTLRHKTAVDKSWNDAIEAAESVVTSQFLPEDVINTITAELFKLKRKAPTIVLK